MNKEIKKRKKRFWACCLAFVLGLGGVLGNSAVAQTVDANRSWYPNEYHNAWDVVSDVGRVNAGDEINFSTKGRKMSVSSFWVYYKDSNGQLLVDDSDAEVYHFGLENPGEYTYTVKAYDTTDFPGKNLAIAKENFKEWQVNYVAQSGSYVSMIQLVAVAYTESNITYVLDNGINASANPATYYEGKEEIALQPADKPGYIFEGWYKDEAFATAVTSIPTTWTGDVTLYAKFVNATGNIHYDLNGGSNDPANPTTYIVGTGVTAFAPAVKEGYTFDGWYEDAAFTTTVTAISATRSGDITLYAKFTEVPATPAPPEATVVPSTPTPSPTPTLPAVTEAPTTTETPENNDDDKDDTTDTTAAAIPAPTPAKEVLYTVQKGDSLWKIARKHGCSLTELKKANADLLNRGNYIFPGWVLKIPQSSASDVSAQTAAAPVNTKIYIVQKGDSLWKIARKNSCTVEEIVILNNLTGDRVRLIFPGQKLLLPVK